ncbi:MAG: sigma-54 dependent transcriptional regulator [Bacteroidales bacterium]|nr:sigma-54 dependent transcriptional regulator [Bacteroidales bacterium]
MGLRTFIVEDDPFYGELLKHYLSLNKEFDVSLFKNGRDCLNNMYKKPHIVSVDFGLPDMRGDVLMKKIKDINPYTHVIIISGQEEIAVAVELLKSGADDYIEKGNNTKELLWNSILKIQEKIELIKEIEELKEQINIKYDFEKNIIGRSAAIRKTFTLIEKAIKTSINVSITGETGTGKELVAKAIHYSSSSKNSPFVAVDMAAIPSELMESELFGHEKGAFTGAVTTNIGKFERAHCGTLFLDEIAELDLNLQSKILRALQEKEIYRVGGTKAIKLNFRLITATHKNLMNEVQEKRFREDLYYRVIGLPIVMPPLRDRDNDILVLAKHFTEVFSKENSLQNFTFSTDAKDKLMQHAYPGNVRELKAIVDLACVMCTDFLITASDITFSSTGNSDDFWENERTIKEYNTEIIRRFLNRYNFDVISVANKLDIGKSTIYNLLKNGEIKK